MVQALQFVPGIQLRQTTAGASLSIRGFGAERVAVMWDGRPLNSEQGGSVDLWSLNLESVERIEVIRGSAGALYGPAAISGAVNLVPKRGFGNTVSARALGGSGRRLRLSAAAGTTVGVWDFRASGFADSRDQQRLGLPSSYQGWGVNAEAGRLSESVSLDVSWSAGADVRDIPGTPGFPTPAATLDTDQNAASLRLDAAIRESQNFTLDLSWLFRGRAYANPANPFGPEHDAHDNKRLLLSAAWEWSRLRVFAEGALDHLESTTDGEQNRNRAAAGMEASQHILGGVLTAVTLRVDAVEGFGPEPVLRATAGKDLTAELQGRISGGTSFRPPTFDDLFWPARASAAGNPDLQPEHAWDAEVGLEYRGRLQASVSAFFSRLTDMIVWSPGPGGVWRPYNVGKARSTGIEASVQKDFRISAIPLSVLASATWLDARNINGNPLTHGTRLAGRPPYRVHGETSISPGRWRLTAGGEAVGAVPLTPGETKHQDAYALLNASVRFMLTPSLWIDLEGQNLTDEYYEDIRGYPTPGRELTLGVRFRSGTP